MDLWNDHKSEPNSGGAATSLTPMNNTTRLDDLIDINLPQESDQDQRETSLDNPSENSPNSRAINQKQCLMAQREKLLWTRLLIQV